VWSYEDGALRSGDEVLTPDSLGNTFA